MAGGEYQNHYNAIRYRINGSGALQSKLISLDSLVELELTDLTMSPQISYYPTLLTNLTQQKAQLEIKTTEINEQFYLRQITVYIKSIATSLPQ